MFALWRCDGDGGGAECDEIATITSGDARRVGESKDCCHQNVTSAREKRGKKKQENSVHLRRNVYFQKASLTSSPSPSKILASPKRSASVPRHRGESAELKDGVYCFWRNLRARSRFLPPLPFWSAISVYLSAGFRVYVGEYSNRTPLGFCMK